MNGSRTNRLSRVIGRTGLAVLGALSALFVAPLAGAADIRAMNSAAGLLGSILYAGLAFYLGIDIPGHPRPPQSSVSERPDLVLLASALGTLVASLAALVALSVFALDARPTVRCIDAICLAWLVGLTLQLIAGSIGRVSPPAVRIVTRAFPQARLTPLMQQIDEEDSRLAQRRDEIHERPTIMPQTRPANSPA